MSNEKQLLVCKKQKLLDISLVLWKKEVNQQYYCVYRLLKCKYQENCVVKNWL